MTAESVADMKNKSIRKRLDAYVREVYAKHLAIIEKLGYDNYLLEMMDI